MLIFAKPQKIFSADFPGQAQPLRTQPIPFAGHTLTFIIVIPDRQVFREVFFGVLEIVLRLGRDHTWNATKPVRTFVSSLHRQAAVTNVRFSRRRGRR